MSHSNHEIITSAESSKYRFLGSPADSDQELSDLEVATVLSRGSQFVKASKSPLEIQQTPYKCILSPYRVSTVLSNVERGNVEAATPSLQGEISIHQMAAQGELLLLQEEINDGADINKPDSHAFTPLFWACSTGQQITADFLIQHGADVNYTAPGGENCLLFASSHGGVGIVEALVGRGVDIDSTDQNGNTALMYAVHGNHSKCVSALLHHGADVTSENHEGYNALDIAIHRGHTLVQQTIEQYMLTLMNKFV